MVETDDLLDAATKGGEVIGGSVLADAGKARGILSTGFGPPPQRGPVVR